jgi:hypothetical protein
MILIYIIIKYDVSCFYAEQPPPDQPYPYLDPDYPLPQVPPSHRLLTRRRRRILDYYWSHAIQLH